MASNAASNSTSVVYISYLYLTEFTWTANVLIPAWPAMTLFGFAANITNIIIFLRIGVNDNVTILLLSLSISDLMYLTLMTPTVCSYIMLIFAPYWPWPTHIIIGIELLYWPAITCYDFSAFLSVWLGVTRCACVAMPLQFKSIFTRSRTVKLVLASFLLAVSLRIPIMTVNRLVWRTDPNTNISYAYMEKPNRKAMTQINDILNRNSILYINFIIMITCVSILSFKLHQASRIRKSYTSTSASQQASEKPDRQGLSAKDLHVIRSVVLVGSIFIMSQAPFLLFSTARLISDSFDINHANRNRLLFFTFSIVSLTCSYLNASVNIFVYYNYNSKYKSELSFMLKKFKKPKTEA
ncbi:chemosensory receptor a [Plakobranchus ocellatus]|uniref:Chemosensory receptor a n=1 Tax=Plakobranchus ocellatus TaxID=259542 RepID=A0AAV4AEU2_9GAST|nr:chemosensory receptor a [Plakobranchus ocellatus]